MGSQRFLQVLLDVPFEGALDYDGGAEALPLADAVIGLRCVVPLGRRKLVGIVVGAAERSALDEVRIKPVSQLLADIAPLNAHWLALTRFAADYYQHPWGEVALPALPPALRQLPGPRYASALHRLRRLPILSSSGGAQSGPRVALNEEQAASVEQLAAD
ncbi:MAG: primosomal protein N', partial [Betaproteobacteria bacterium]